MDRGPRPSRETEPGSVATVTQSRFRAMGTDVHVVLVVDGTSPVSRGLAGELLGAARAEVERLESLWSRFRPDSEITVVNRAESRPVIVSPETFDLVALAVDAWWQTDGVFDPTVGSTMVAAGYDRTFEVVRSPARGGPTDTAPGLAQGLSRPPAAPTPVGVELDADLRSIRLPTGVALDLGGIGKGAAADAVASLCTARGADGCCVNLGGDLRVIGRSPEERGWRVTLDCPGSGRTIELALGAGAVCTSTTVERRWHHRGRAEHHLRCARTGDPLASGLVTASVVGARATQAEVLAKVALAAGADDAPPLMTGHQTTGALVDRAGVVHVVDGLEAFTVEHAPADGREQAS